MVFDGWLPAHHVWLWRNAGSECHVWQSGLPVVHALFLRGYVGCLLLQVQALRAVEKHLGLEALYVLGTNCVDNGPRQGLEKFLNAASSEPDTVLHYEFMQVSSCLMNRVAISIIVAHRALPANIFTQMLPHLVLCCCTLEL